MDWSGFSLFICKPQKRLFQWSSQGYDDVVMLTGCTHGENVFKLEMTEG